MASTKQNTPGLGIEYEVHLPAYFALLLNTNQEIEDFKLRSNVEEFGNLDDLLVDIKTKSGENLYFAFQLKHKEKSSKNLLPTNFEAKGDFNLEKYCEAFKKLNEENRKKHHFILYTNKNFDSSRTNEVKKFDMKQDECCLGRDFFDTSCDGKHLYKFEVNEETEDGKNVTKDDFREFFSQFSLYTGQANIRDLDKSYILKILKYEECYVKYVDFFRRWHRGDFTDKILDKKMLNLHLIDILLSPVAINYHFSDGLVRNLNFFEALVQHFDITIIDVSKQDFIKQLEKNIHKYPEEFNKNSEEEIIKLGKKSKLIDRFTKEVNEDTKLKLLHYFFQKPLILDLHESSKDIIYEATKLCRIQENGIKLVIVGPDIDASKFSHLKIFTNLTAVDGNFLEEIKRRCKLSLQGRNISFEEIFGDEICEFVNPRAIFQMLKGCFLIGEDKERLPECYIPRTVSTTVFDIESIIKHFSRSNALIFYYEGKLEVLKVLIQNIVDQHDYLYEDSPDAIILRMQEVSKNQDISRDTFPEIIILRREECSTKQFDEIREKLRREKHSRRDTPKETSRNGIHSNDRLDDICKEPNKEKEYVHLFQVVDEKRCLLLMSTQNLFYNQNYESTKIPVEEDKIHVFFSNSINILCAQPGMGKSALMRYLKNQCDPNFWTVMVDLKAYNPFLKGNPKIEEVLKYFLLLENCQDLFLLNIKGTCLRKKRIVFFLDGLDEVENECVDCVLNISKQLSEMGFRIWLSSRQNLQQKLENYFNILSIEIDEINEKQQKKYIEERLSSQYNENEIEEIVKKIFNNTDLANNCQILEILLQLHIITQIFLDERSYYYNLSKNNFILTKMLEVFFEGKHKHFVAKIKAENLHFLETLEDQLKNYELVALHSVLDDKHFQKLQIENFKLSQIKNWDFRLGIITAVNSENKAVFEHFTYAEYFASKFLVKNFDKVRILREEIFSEKYQNLFLIFNIMLAEDSPLHLSIIYKDLSLIQEWDESSVVDKGGRNFLQVAACIATRHPFLESNLEPSSLVCLVNDKFVQHFKGDFKIKEIVNYCVLSSEPFKNDKIFEWNSLDYALAAGALYIVEAILEKIERPFNFYELLGQYYSDEVVAYYSIRFGYHRLLSEILAKKSCHVPGIVSNYLWEKGNNSILHFLFLTLNRTDRTRIVELLTGDDVNKTVYDKDGYTFLHFAIFYGDKELIKFLLGKKADVDILDKHGFSPLLWAASQSNLELSKLLVENGADVNIQDKGGWSSLRWAVERKNLDILKLLVGKFADVNIKDKDGLSPLFLAAERNNFEISKFLVENGADVNIKDKDGWSPLLLAVKRKNLESSKLFVENGAYVNIQNRDRWSPLLLAVKLNNLEISKLFVENGANVNIQNKNGWTPLLLAVVRKNLDISNLLVENGADVNIQNNDWWSPFCRALEQKQFEILKLLLEKGADVNIQNKQGWSPIRWAVKRKNFDILKLLVENGADVNIQNKGGWSPLCWALEQKQLEIFKLLLEKGADVNIHDKQGWSPLRWAVKRKNFDILKLLVENGADVNIKDKDGCSPLLLAVKQNSLEISKWLVENGANVNIQDKEGWSPLRWTVDRKNFDILKLLVENGADVNLKDKNGRSPLTLSVERNNIKMTTLLVEIGANVNYKNEYGKSPLLLAVERNSFEISKLLLEKGADVNTNDKYRSSPLLLSVEKDNLEMTKMLLEKGADVNIKDKNGKSPLFYAIKQHNTEISKLLFKSGAEVNREIRDAFYSLLPEM